MVSAETLAGLAAYAADVAAYAALGAAVGLFLGIVAWAVAGRRGAHESPRQVPAGRDAPHHQGQAREGDGEWLIPARS